MVSFTGASGNLVPFTSTDVSGSWQHLVSRRTTLTATLGFSDYDPDSTTTPSSKTYSGTLGANSEADQAPDGQRFGRSQGNGQRGRRHQARLPRQCQPQLQEEARRCFGVVFGIGGAIVARRHPEQHVVRFERRLCHQRSCPRGPHGHLQQLHLTDGHVTTAVQISPSYTYDSPGPAAPHSATRSSGSGAAPHRRVQPGSC